MKPTPPPASHVQRGDLAADIRSTLLAKILYLITRVGLPPLILSNISLAEYGIWAIGFVVVSYIGLAATGFSTVFVRRGASLRDAPDANELGRLLSTGVSVLLPLALALLGTLWLALPQLLNLLQVSTALHDAAAMVTIGTCAVFLADISLGAYAHVMLGLGMIRQQQRIWVISYLLEFALIVLLLALGGGLAGLLFAFALRYAYSIAAAAWQLHRAVPGLRLRLGRLDRNVLADLRSFGLMVQVSALLATALHSADRLLAGLLLGPHSVALFDLAGKLPSTMTSIPSSVSAVAMPWAAAHHKEASALAGLYLRTTRVVALLTSLPMPFLAAFAPALMMLWLGPRAELATLASIMSMVALSAQLHILTGPGSAVFRGRGNATNEFVYHALRIGLIATATATAIFAMGATPLALAAALLAGQTCAALLYLLWNHHHLKANWNSLASRVLAPALFAYPCAGASMLLVERFSEEAANRAEALLQLMAAGSLYLMLALPVMWRWILRDDERLSVLRRIARHVPFSPLKVR